MQRPIKCPSLLFTAIFVFVLAELNLVHLSHLLDKVFLIFPNYCLGMSFSQFYQNYEFIKFCTSSPLSERICDILSKFCLNRADDVTKTMLKTIHLIECFYVFRYHVPNQLLLNVRAWCGSLPGVPLGAGRRLQCSAVCHRAAVCPHRLQTPHLSGQKTQTGGGTKIF